MENFSKRQREREFWPICGGIGITRPKDVAPEAAEAVEGEAHQQERTDWVSKGISTWRGGGGWWK